MPRPHPLALFSLVPENEWAKVVLIHPSKSHLVSALPRGERLAFDIGFHIRSKPSNTLATLGLNDTDIILEGASIARLQCSFEINLETSVIMLYDRSNGQITQAFGENATSFKYGCPHRVSYRNISSILLEWAVQVVTFPIQIGVASKS